MIAFYHKTSSPSPLLEGSFISSAHPLQFWCEETYLPKYEELVRIVQKKSNDLQRTGHTVINAQIDSYRPIVPSLINKNLELTMHAMIILYQVRPDTSPRPPDLYVDGSLRSRSRSHKSLADTVARRMTNEPVLNISFDTYMPLIFGNIGKIIPEETVVTVISSRSPTARTRRSRSQRQRSTTQRRRSSPHAKRVTFLKSS